MKRSILGTISIIMALILISCQDPATGLPDKVITLLAIPAVVAPVRGAVPVTTAIDTVQYTGTISWIGEPALFAALTAYTANIVLTPKSGWTLSGVEANSFTVAGATVTNSPDSGSVAAVFIATGSALPSDYNSDTIGILKGVPSGSFQRDATDTNISTITADFRMSQHEITRAQFLLVTGLDPSDVAISPDPDTPVQNLSFYHSIMFCNKLSILEGLTPVYTILGSTNPSDWGAIPGSANVDWNNALADWTANGYRLPTEMEWMWAAMGVDTSNFGNLNTTGYLKAFSGSTGSNSIDDYVQYFRNSGDVYLTGAWNGDTILANNPKTLPIGSKLANELGIFDLSGNVLELCWDINADYPAGLLVDYKGSTTGTMRISHSGSWFAPETSCSVTFRHVAEPEVFWKNRGLRVVRN